MFYSVDISRTNQDDTSKYHDSRSFSRAELLRVACLSDITYTEISYRFAYEVVTEVKGLHSRYLAVLHREIFGIIESHYYYQLNIYR